MNQNLEYIVATFTAISAIATVVYTLITFKTLKEIKIQRETTYKPDLIVEGRHFYVYSTKRKTVDFPIEYTYDVKPKGYFSNAKFSEFTLKIYNIGLATAKNIRFKYSIKPDDIIKLNQSLGFIENEKRVQIIQDKDKVEFKRFDESYDLPSGSHFFSSQSARPLNHLLPVNIDNNSFELQIPTYFLWMNSYWLFNLTNSTGNNNIYQDPITINLNIQYEDIGNKTHKKDIHILFKYNAITSEVAYGYFFVQENNQTNILSII